MYITVKQSARAPDHKLSVKVPTRKAVDSGLSFPIYI